MGTRSHRGEGCRFVAYSHRWRRPGEAGIAGQSQRRFQPSSRRRAHRAHGGRPEIGSVGDAAAMRFWLLVIPFALAAADNLHVPAGLDAYLPVPENNPLTREKVELGRKLFFDPSLSRDRTVSCATCHDPVRAFTDARPLAIGIAGRTGTRRVPRLVNRGYGKSFCWAGRA